MTRPLSVPQDGLSLPYLGFFLEIISCSGDANAGLPNRREPLRRGLAHYSETFTFETFLADIYILRHGLAQALPDFGRGLVWILKRQDS
jgi:hypothetical protein